MNKRLCLLLALLPVTAMANLKTVTTPGIAPDAVTAVKMYFNGNINQEKINELTMALDEANMRFKNAHDLYLYINSAGGDLDSAHAAYLAIKSSRIPVTTVDISMTASAATVLFCGARNRIMLTDTAILIHPPTVNQNEKSSAPDSLALKRQWSEHYVDMLKNVYRQCTTLSDEAMNKALYSEDAHLFLNNQEAEKIGIATATEDRIHAAEFAYFISDGQDRNKG
ncbi:ATP-dependent Clp protease proteolytic subunit [Dickeya fangzhongdai]|uniref:ATP-dependent Clp protease proteolytic subunit n=3 Tax=Pectobacteriaceae TaxID=1903410 RepID=UPI0004F593C5|nr:ATP-dependent Clp protease proteolytic subunit [Dickeya fangzhongdai]AIR71213.1 peptidase S14 [Dickeya fangzhongdai]KHN63165.1 peptidase S14 [Dickeya fangzhongdai]WPD75308.1 ATP-dependent Clp protease proteolytic subunit [Dickeya fangzhongdai]